MEITSGVQQVTEQIIYQIVPEAYQAQAIWFLGIIGSLMALYYFTKPWLDNWRANKQNAVIAANSLTSEDVADAVTKGMIEYKKGLAYKDITTWEYKLLHATSEEAKDICNLEIAKAQAEYNSYA